MFLPVPNRTLTVPIIILLKNRIWVGLSPGSYNFQSDLSWYPGFSRFPILYGSLLEYLIQIEREMQD